MEPAVPLSEPPAPEYEPAVLPIERAAAALEVILCSGFPTQIVIVTVLSTFGMHARLGDGRLSPPFVFTLTLADTLLLVGLIVFFFRAHRESPREQLFGPARLAREIGLGVVLIPASFFLVVFILMLVQVVVPSLRNVPHNPLADLVKTRGDAALFAFVVTMAGGVREEIQRGFVLRRFEQYLGGGIAGLIVFSALFGLGHLEQGRDVAIATGVLGAFWGAIFLRRRSIAAPMVGHAGFNLAQVLKFMMGGA
ncbi:MAG TPA: CPBP family intramembrane glutamic endopeptidase [Vicinamibacterales bacterium]|nr:CPBP family intramembrane glutamic endopeptidase [Vicinamibacterales bacterium]